MTDVARIAGVSQSSVSLVLNDMTGARISAETQSRVFEAARQIGYELPAIAPRAGRRRSRRNTIAYLVDEISTSPHPVVNLDGARDFAFEQGFLVAAHVTRSNPELEAGDDASDPARSLGDRRHLFDHLHAPVSACRRRSTSCRRCCSTAMPSRASHLSILPGEVVGGFNATRT